MEPQRGSSQTSSSHAIQVFEERRHILERAQMYLGRVTVCRMTGPSFRASVQTTTTATTAASMPISEDECEHGTNSSDCNPTVEGAGEGAGEDTEEDTTRHP